MNVKKIIEKLLRGENLKEIEIGFFLVDTLNSERVYQEVFKRRGSVEHMRTVKRVRGKLYETLWERTATDCMYPSQPYEIKDNPYWQSLTNSNKATESDEPKPALYLYALTQEENLSHLGHFDACIVCAESEDEAKRIHPDGREVWDYEEPEPWRAWAESPEYVRCKLIGTAVEGIEKGVFMARYIPLEPDD